MGCRWPPACRVVLVQTLPANSVRSDHSRIMLAGTPFLSTCYSVGSVGPGSGDAYYRVSEEFLSTQRLLRGAVLVIATGARAHFQHASNRGYSQVRQTAKRRAVHSTRHVTVFLRVALISFSSAATSSVSGPGDFQPGTVIWRCDSTRKIAGLPITGHLWHWLRDSWPIFGTNAFLLVRGAGRTRLYPSHCRVRSLS